MISIEKVTEGKMNKVIINGLTVPIEIFSFFN